MTTCGGLGGRLQRSKTGRQGDDPAAGVGFTCTSLPRALYRLLTACTRFSPSWVAIGASMSRRSTCFVAYPARSAAASVCSRAAGILPHRSYRAAAESRSSREAARAGSRAQVGIQQASTKFPLAKHRGNHCCDRCAGREYQSSLAGRFTFHSLGLGRGGAIRAPKRGSG